MLSVFEQKFWSFLDIRFPRLHGFLWNKRLVLAFLVAGGVALAADVGTLYVSKGIFGVALVPAVALAFLAGFCVSFLLQKFWTFGDLSVDRVHTQASLYFIVAVVNFFITEVSMHFLVVILLVQYILAKIFVAGGIAFVTFFIYKIFIFRKSSQTDGGRARYEDK